MTLRWHCWSHCDVIAVTTNSLMYFILPEIVAAVCIACYQSNLNMLSESSKLGGDYLSCDRTSTVTTIPPPPHIFNSLARMFRRGGNEKENV